ncbi:hypothetical protein GLOIN_2v1735026 [Rhizophagus irregularis DAOM 181602=DAOM 197198]|nr:hypothetical protein GLOIN_2v1735026 [Rhizophagus irregularis DAOM 181602=DAOM 197198]
MIFKYIYIYIYVCGKYAKNCDGRAQVSQYRISLPFTLFTNYLYNLMKGILCANFFFFFCKAHMSALAS